MDNSGWVCSLFFYSGYNNIIGVNMEKKKIVKPLVLVASAIAGLFVTKEVMEYYILKGIHIGR